MNEIAEFIIISDGEEIEENTLVAFRPNGEVVDTNPMLADEILYQVQKGERELEFISCFAALISYYSHRLCDLEDHIASLTN